MPVYSGRHYEKCEVCGRFGARKYVEDRGPMGLVPRKEPIMILRKGVPCEVEDEGGVLFTVEATASGSLTALVRVYGQVIIDGEAYAYDQKVRVKLRKKVTLRLRKNLR